MTKFYKLGGLALLTALAGCGEQEPDETRPLAAYLGTVGDSFEITDEGGDTYTVAVGGADVAGVFTAAPDFEENGFMAYRSGDKLLYLMDTTSGDTGAALLFHGTKDPGGIFVGPSLFAGGAYARDAGTILPTSGTATFLGDYIGVIQSNADGFVDSYVVGDLTLDANFVANTISGSITNRADYSPLSGTAYAGDIVQDVTLNPSIINADGTYAGTAAGGATSYMDNNVVSTAPGTYPGTYEGVIGGATGNETAGAVVIDYDLTGVPSNYAGDLIFTEYGVFVAEE